MKKHIFNFIMLFLVFFECPIYSQKTSADTSAFKIQSKYNDRNSAWYINTTAMIMNPERGKYFTLGIGTTAEFKLSGSHSLSSGLNLYYMRDEWFSHFGTHYSRLSLDLSYRYYYNLKNRMSKGLTGNNFFANYILITPFLLFDYKPYSVESYKWDFNKGEWMIKSVRKFKVEPMIYLGYGLQRNILKRLNFDANAGFLINSLPDFREPFSLFYLQLNLRYTIK